VESYFCDRPKDFAVLSRGIFISGTDEQSPLRSLWESAAFPAPRPGAHGLYRYTILLNIARKESSRSVPPQIGFDLATGQSDVCISLSGGYLFHTVTSNVVKVDAKMIRDAVK
jgi:hypothetical protein